VLTDRSQWAEYMTQEGLLFKGNQLFIPKCSMRDNLLKEKHSGGLARHFGHDKNIHTVEQFILLARYEDISDEICEQM
jgi:hypothetical protein